MVSWQYRCKSCGGTHAAARRPEGTMYLRCLVAREWAWYEPSSFLTAPEGGRAHSTGAGASRPRPAARRRAPAARRPRRAAARKTRRKAGKKR